MFLQITQFNCLPLKIIKNRMKTLYNYICFICRDIHLKGLLNDLSINMDLVCAGIKNKGERFVFPKRIRVESLDIGTHRFGFSIKRLLNTKYSAMITHRHSISESILYPYQFI